MFKADKGVKYIFLGRKYVLDPLRDMMKPIFSWNGKPIPKHVWILLAIVAVGFFVRAYQYHDWLRFSPDEARDATYIRDALTGTSPLPDLGPQAGNTRFYLGPLYYQALYVSAVLFGTAPAAFAYPDLLFSILVIPLLYVYLRKMFSREMSLFLTAVLALSSFVIETARFSSNPNSIPFFLVLFLLGLLGVMERGESVRKRWWAAAVGIGLGVGIQLHALLFLTMPTVAVVVVAYLIYRKKLSWKDIVIALACFAIVNIGQLSSEWRTGGSNTKQLFNGAQSESSIGGGTLFRNVEAIAECQIQANAHIVIAPIDYEKCGAMFGVSKAAAKRALLPGFGSSANGIAFASVMILAVVFSLGGYFLAFRRMLRESDGTRRNLLGLFLLYNAVALLVMVPVASQIGVHYFNVLIFVPFLLLGFWLELLLGWQLAWTKRILYAVMAIVLAVNAVFLAGKAQVFLEKRVSDVDNSILGEITPMLDYLVAGSGQPDRVYIDGSTFYLKRFLKPFVYLGERKGVRMITPDTKAPFAPGTRYFYITGTKPKNPVPGDMMKGDRVVAVQVFQQITIYTMLKGPSMTETR